MRLVLASGSPRRRDLLTSIGLTFDVRPADVDETWTDGEDPSTYVQRVALAKARAGVEQIGDARDVVVLAADTTIDLSGEILAKPDDDGHARRMLHALSGRNHQVLTAVVGVGPSTEHAVLVSTDINFRSISDAEIDWYLSLGEHRDKAGAYGMQGAAGAFVEHISGSPSNVIGLPLVETIDVLRACGVVVAGG